MRFVLRVARVERPTHGASHHIETTDHAAGHVGLHVVSHATANHHGGAGHQRRGGQLVVAVRDITQTSLQIYLTVVAETLTELAGVSIDRDQTSIDGVGQQTTLAIGGRCWFGFDDFRIGRLSDGGGGVEIGHATAALPDFRLSVDRVLPQLFAGVGIQRNQVVVRSADEHLVANLQRGQLVFGAVAIALGDVTGVVSPRDFQLVDVGAIDLVQRGEAAATFGIAVVGPVLCALSGSTGVRPGPVPVAATVG